MNNEKKFGSLNLDDSVLSALFEKGVDPKQFVKQLESISPVRVNLHILNPCEFELQLTIPTADGWAIAAVEWGWDWSRYPESPLNFHVLKWSKAQGEPWDWDTDVESDEIV